MSASRPARSPYLDAGFLIGPASVTVILVLALPLLLLFRFSFNRFVPGQFMVEARTVENYVRFFADSYYSNVMLVTIGVATVTTLLCLVLGFPTAYLLARTASRYKTLMVMLVVMPLFVGNAVRAAGSLVVFGRRGLLNGTPPW